MATVYKGILTNNGKALIANATVNNKVNYSHIALGDGNGSVPTPSETRPALINEKARIALNVVEISSSNANQIVCEAIIPSNVGGFYIRELGLYAGATMVVNSNYPPTYKPLAEEGGAREINLKLIINVQKAKKNEVKLGDGEPVRRLRHTYLDEKSARAVAQSALDSSKRNEDKISIELPGDPLLSAEAKLSLSSFRSGIDGDWLIDSVTHSIDKTTGFVSLLEGVKSLNVET